MDGPRLEFKAQQASASAQMQRMPYPSETVLSNKITRIIIVLSFKDLIEYNQDRDLTSYLKR